MGVEGRREEDVATTTGCCIYLSFVFTALAATKLLFFQLSVTKSPPHPNEGNTKNTSIVIGMEYEMAFGREILQTFPSLLFFSSSSADAMKASNQVSYFPSLEGSKGAGPGRGKEHKFKLFFST